MSFGYAARSGRWLRNDCCARRPVGLRYLIFYRVLRITEALMDLSGPDDFYTAGPVDAGTLAFTIGAGPENRVGRAIAKRVLDYCVTAFAILFLSPLLLLIAAAIKLDSPGPVFFTQPRRGLNNKNFVLVKFRSMHAHLSDIDAARQTSRGDPRVTRVGKWLRRLSFDEFPQLLNVLRGEMSLVGPRPHTPNTRVQGELLEVASGDYLQRYSVKPGLTGWAQVNGVRGALVTRDDLDIRVAYDLEYIRIWSIGLDLKIIFLTVMREIFSKNAF